jgi:pimeloyl-[acyl-carrier protein] methyl ester esterase
MRHTILIPLLLAATAVFPSGARAQDAAKPDPKQPETPRESPGGAYDGLPEVAKKMILSADERPVTVAAAVAGVTPVAGIETRGSGPVHLVLIPGLACDWTVWEAFMRRGEGRYTMHAVTLPGVGGSTVPPMPDPEQVKWSDDVWMANAGRAVVEAIAGLKLATPPVVVGHSLGGHLALRLATRHPQVIRGAVMLDAYAAVPLAGGAVLPIEARRTIVDNQMPSWFDTAMVGNDSAGLKRMFSTGTMDEGRGQVLAEMAVKTPAAVNKRYLLELCAADLTGELKTLERPVLVLAAIPPLPPAPQVPAGMEAPVPQDGREATRGLWRTQFGGAEKVTLEFVEPSRHFIMDDQPAKMDELIAAFIERLPK